MGHATYEQIGTPTLTSDRWAQNRFGTADAAEKYAGALVGTKKDRQERACIARALAGLPAGARLLDLPCGTGRLLPFLTAEWRVTAADSSPHMVERACRLARDRGVAADRVEFHVAEVAETDFDDDAFDAVVCNRLFHHLTEPEARRRALRELRRVCAGPIVVSFFRKLGYDALMHRLKYAVRRRSPSDRVCISLRTFKRDIDAAGLELLRALGTRPLVSRQWYVLLRRRR